MNTNLITTHDPEYDKAFWNAMKGNTAHQQMYFAVERHLWEQSSFLPILLVNLQRH